MPIRYSSQSLGLVNLILHIH